MDLLKLLDIISEKPYGICFIKIIEIHWSADYWDCSMECPKNRTRSFRSQMVNKQGRI